MNTKKTMLVLVLTIAAVAVASDISVTGISIPQVHEADFLDADHFGAPAIGALGTLLGGGFVLANGDDTLYTDGDTVARIQSACYAGTGTSAGLFAYCYQNDCTGGNVAPYTVEIPLSGATLDATAAGLSSTPLGYIATFFDVPVPFEPLPFTLYTGSLVPFNLSEFGGSSGIGGNTAAGWTGAAESGGIVIGTSTTDNFWSGTILLFVTDRAPVISHITVTAGIASGQPNTLAALVPGPGVGPTPDLPPEEIITDPPEFDPVIVVELDVKPGSNPNAVNTKSKGQLPIGIYGSGTFDVAEIDVDTIAVECMGISAGGFRTSFEDLVVEDGIADMILHVPMQAFPWTGAIRGTLVDIIVTGFLFDGTAFFGDDEVLIVK